MMRVKTFTPVIRVTLIKLIQRSALQGGGSAAVSQRFSGAKRTVDLTRFLGEGSAVQTHKSLREAAGGFQVTLIDKPYGEGSDIDSFYGAVEPMDGIEIRISHGPLSGGGGADPAKPPLVMRGFVSEISRSMTMGANGRPSRTVTIAGQDYGKIWQQVQIWYFPGYVIGQWLLSGLRLFERFGVGADAMAGAEFVRQVATQILNPYLAALAPSGGSMPSSFDTSRVTVAHGTTSITGPQNAEGPIYGIMKRYLDVGAWNELFIEDSEDAVHIVYRPNPAKSVSGDLIMPGATAPEVVEVPREDVVSAKFSRTDANVANFYWVRSPVFDLNSDMYRLLDAQASGDRETVDLSEYPNAQQRLYGVRTLYETTQMGGDDVRTFQSGRPAQEHDERDVRQVDWIKERRRQVVEQNKDNIIFESGAFRLRGNEKLRAGVTLRLKFGALTADYYVVSVQHNFEPMRSYTTDVTVERGTGFIERVQRGGGTDSPYLAEQQAGAPG